MVGRATGVEGPFLQLQATIFKWWNAECSAKLRPIFNAIPSFILWEIWKGRNKVKHGDGASKGNPRPSAGVFCIRNWE
ncbi:hypothetical protein KY285_016347 [Solanum tuberosum]|nr:hypothetical protein KY284_016341 [Solanum tuberosum]KAH0702069.1 hypothetical protein KY285_016347 [Solanum tuberosum]